MNRSSSLLKSAILLGALCAGTFVALPASAACWSYLATSEDNSKIDMDLCSVRKDYSYTYVWTKTTHVKPKILERSKKAYVEVKRLYKVNCSQRQLGVESAIAYGKSGKAVHSESGYANMEAAIPESIGEAILEGACTG